MNCYLVYLKSQCADYGHKRYQWFELLLSVFKKAGSYSIDSAIFAFFAEIRTFSQWASCCVPNT